MITFYEHQTEALNRLYDFDNVAFFHDCGLGKTFTGAEKLYQLNTQRNLVICQKSKLSDWLEHFTTYYGSDYIVYDLTKTKNIQKYLDATDPVVGIINYDVIFRRNELSSVDTLLCDESGLLTNEHAKRTKFILNMDYKHIILLSGTICGGKYENILPQLKLLGYTVSESAFYNMYVDYGLVQNGWNDKRKHREINGYKNVDHLKKKMRLMGCDFLKTEDVLHLPEQITIPVIVDKPKEYNVLRKKKIVTVDGIELVADTALTELLYLRKICGAYNRYKLQAFEDLLNSTLDGFVVFYNFNDELNELLSICGKCGRMVSVINGSRKDLEAYDKSDHAVVLVQYQSGALGLNLQKYNRIIYYSPVQWSELFQQSIKRIHRIGQTKTCFYYRMITKDSIESEIYMTLDKLQDYTDALFLQKFTQ